MITISSAERNVTKVLSLLRENKMEKIAEETEKEISLFGEISFLESMQEENVFWEIPLDIQQKILKLINRARRELESCF